jgi:hypothetical protein
VTSAGGLGAMSVPPATFNSMLQDACATYRLTRTPMAVAFYGRIGR